MLMMGQGAGKSDFTKAISRRPFDARLPQIVGDLAHQWLVLVRIESRRAIPVIKPRRMLSELGSFRLITRKYMRMQSRFRIAQYFVVDSISAGHVEECIPNDRDLLQIGLALRLVRYGQVAHDRVWEKHRIAFEELHITEHDPSCGHSQDGL
jgi:hypothetical protein